MTSPFDRKMVLLKRRMEGKVINFSAHRFSLKMVLTKCRICGERYTSLEFHVEMKGDPAHLILGVMES